MRAARMSTAFMKNYWQLYSPLPLKYHEIPFENVNFHLNFRISIFNIPHPILTIYMPNKMTPPKNPSTEAMAKFIK
jgi:hypothetical protein